MDNKHVDVKAKKNENNSIFNIFGKLTEETGKNGKPCVSLIKSLQGGEFSVGSGSNTQYSIKRLVKGLCSTRFNTQCACFAALTCVLKFHSINIEELLEVVDKELAIEGATKSEEGFSHAGCLLTCGAIIHSGLFSSQPENVQQNILDKIIKSGKSRSYLTLLSYQFLLDLVDSPNFKVNLWPVYKKELEEVSNADAWYFLLACYKKKPKLVSKFIDKNFTSINSVLKKCLKLLLETTIQQEHPLYGVVSQLVVENSNLFDIYQKTLNESSKIKDSALIIFLLSNLKNLKDVTVIPKLLNLKIIEALLRVLTFNKGKANDSVVVNGKAILDKIVELLKDENVDDQVRLETIEKFNFYPANLKFEKKTGSRCVIWITLQLKKKGVKELAKTYQKILNGELKKKIDAEGNLEDWNSKEKQYVLFNYVKLMNHSAVKSETSWKLSQIKFIYNLGFLRNINCTSEVQKNARDCFYKAVEPQMPKLEDLMSLLDNLLIYVNENLPVVKNYNEEAWAKMFTTVQKLKKKGNKKLYTAIHLMLIYMGFQLFDNSNLAELTIDELISCYSHLKEIHKKNDNETEEPHWTEVTIDLILSLLSRENKLYRHVVSCVFPQIVEYMTPTALHQIIDSLDPRSDRKILSHPDDQSDSEEEGEDEEEEEEGDDDGKSEEEDDDDSVSTLTEEAGDEDEKINDQLRVAIRNALGNSAAAGSDAESVDMDQMDEEEAKRLNDNLSAAFQMFKSNSNEKKKKQTKKDEILMHFRIRVLDLLEIFLANNQNMGGCLDIILPCFELYEFAMKDVHQKPLQNRVESVLKKIPSSKKFENNNGVTEETILNIFKALIERKEASSLMFVEMAPRISEICTFLVRCSQSIPAKNSKILLVNEYDALLKDFFQGKDNRLPASIFQLVLRIAWVGNWRIVGTIFKVVADPNIRIFKKMLAINMLLVFYKNEKLHQTAEEDVKREFNEVETEFAVQFSNYLKKNEKIKSKPTENMSAAFFVNLLNLIEMAYRSHNRHRNTNKIPPWKNLVAELVKIDVVRSNKKSKRLINHLGGLLGVTVPEAEKRKRTVSNSSVKSDASAEEKITEVVNGPGKKKKKNRSPDKKKEAKKLREEAASKGLESVNFSSLNYSSLPEPEVTEEDGQIVKKSKKRKSSEGLVNGDSSKNNIKKNKNKKMKTK